MSDIKERLRDPFVNHQTLREAADYIEQLEKDAARYEWLRGKVGVSDWGSVTLPCGSTKFTKEETDAQIDTALSHTK